MTLSTLLYVLAGILTIFIIVSIAITRKFSLSDSIALLGIIVSIIVAQSISQANSPGPTITQTLQPVASSTVATPEITSTSSGPLIADTEIPNWAISFEYRFPAGFWSTGNHEYTLESNCPNLRGTDGNPFYGIITRTFLVSEDAALLPGDVYFRISGLRDGIFESQEVEKVHPQQTTTAVLSLIENTRSEAELAITDCTITISWDGGIPKQLTPGLPFQR